MIQREPMFKRVLGAIGGLALIVGLIVLYNGWLWLSEGAPTIPSLEGRWWAGYYETSQFGRQWCVARFVKAPSGRLQMALLSSWGSPDIFNVESSTSSETFVYLTFTEPQGPMRIEAKQMYDGKRYFLGRLMVGRFRDFWKMNDDVSIRGNFSSISPPREFAIEPISEDELASFWKKYVRPDQPTPWPAEILRMADVLRDTVDPRGTKGK